MYYIQIGDTKMNEKRGLVFMKLTVLTAVKKIIQINVFQNILVTYYFSYAKHFSQFNLHNNLHKFVLILTFYKRGN